MDLIRLRIAAENSPESLKRGLLKDRLARALRVNRFNIRRRIDFASRVESGTWAEKVDEQTPRRKVLWAKANDYVNGRRIGNGLDVNAWRWKSRLLPDIVVGTGPDAIHLPHVEVTHRRTGWTCRIRVVHKPTKRAGNKSLRPVVDQVLREHARRDDAADIPWITLGDFNGSTDLGIKLAGHGPDHIRASRHFEPLGQKVVARPLLSDHSFLIADAAVEV